VDRCTAGHRLAGVDVVGVEGRVDDTVAERRGTDRAGACRAVGREGGRLDEDLAFVEAGEQETSVTVGIAEIAADVAAREMGATNERGLVSNTETVVSSP
jgi:hypothetical protein